MKATVLGGLAIVTGVLALMAGPAAGDGGWVVVASGLDNPRGLALEPGGPNGYTLYVAEAGRGGNLGCGIAAGGEFSCLGFSGAVTKITGVGSQRRVASGLPSVAAPGGFAATGPSDVGLWDGLAYVPIGFGSSPANRAAFGPLGSSLGTLARVPLASGQRQTIGDFVAFEGAFNPDGGDINGNPNAALATPGHRYVVDAGANDLIDVRTEGGAGLSVRAVFPRELVPAPPFLGLPPGTMIPQESSPTSIVRGPDNALYVGELTGFPFAQGSARVFRIDPHSIAPPTVYATGFTCIMDLDFDEDGNLYVLEFQHAGLLSDDPTGALIRVAPSGARTTVASTGLVFPAGLAVHGYGAFVSNFGVSPGVGQVVRIPLG